MELSRYRIMMKGKDKADKADARLHVIRHAQKHGNKATARIRLQQKHSKALAVEI